MQIRNYAAVVSGCFLLFFSAFSWAWTVSESFDGQADGDYCGTFWKMPHDVTVTSQQSSSGGKSCRFGVNQGATGWGSGFVLPTTLRKGDEVWVRFRLFLPAGFDYGAYSAGNRLKFLRFETKDSSVSSPKGHLDWMWNREGTVPPFQKMLEQDNCTTNCWETFGAATDKPQRGVWETYEMYVKIDTIPVDQGGTGRVRTWKNGKLMGDLTNRRTLNDDNDTVPAVQVFYYWNGGAPQTQHLFFDDLIATDSPPGTFDSHGNPYIGVGNFVAVAAPLPPASIQ